MSNENQYSYTPTPLFLLKSDNNQDDSEYRPCPAPKDNWYEPDSLSVAYNPNFQFDKKICDTPRYAPYECKLDPSPPHQDLSKTSNKKIEPVKKKKEIKKQKLDQLINDLYDSSDEELPALTHNKKTQEPRISISSSVKIPPRPPEIEVKNFNDNSQPLSRPSMPERSCSFVPLPIRMRYLDQFIEYYLKICESESEAYRKSLYEEQRCINESMNRPKYLRAVVIKLRELKDLSERAEKRTKPKSLQSLQPKTRSDPSNSLIKPSPSSTISQNLLRPLTFDERLKCFVESNFVYGYLKEFLLNSEQLFSNGFPIKGEFKGSAKIMLPEKMQSLKDIPFGMKMCCRCGVKYKVDQFGQALVTNVICEYHWGKPISTKTVTGWQARYSCCDTPVGTNGCCICQNGHVHDENKWLDTEGGWVEPLPPISTNEFDQPADTLTKLFAEYLITTKVPRNATVKTIEEVCDANFPPKSCKVFALDCEMVYTTKGYELGRVTIVDTRCNVVMDKLVKPSGKIIDCNTRFSGLNATDFDTVTEYLTHVQLELLQLFDSDVILVGHSLENDLIALKWIHPNVVDTSVVFPHKYGPPKKRALKNLALELINMPIQNNLDGHDSKEDAVAALRIMQYKVKELIRKQRRISNTSS